MILPNVYIYPKNIDKFMYGIDPPNPPADLATFGPRLLIVAREDVSAHAIRKVLETVFSAGFARIFRPPLDVNLLEIPPEYELHPGTREYLEHNKPVMAGDVIDTAREGMQPGRRDPGRDVLPVAMGPAAISPAARPRASKRIW